jgi:hypothetical protein
MTVSKQPSFLPQYPLDPVAYDRLYAFNHGTDDYSEQTRRWKEIRLKPGLSEIEVYRKLPHASAFEYGGYITKSRIRFRRCEATRAFVLSSKLCTFHSHPASLEGADAPSIGDVFHFLNFREVRTVTVGPNRIWVWDKTKATMATVRNMARWIEANMLTEIHRLEKKYPHAWHRPYLELVLKNLGLPWPKRFRDWENHWPEMLQDQLRIKVRVFPCDDGDVAK